VSDPDVRPTSRTDEERAALFDELMRLERKQNKAPLSGFAVAALVFGLLGGFIGLVFGIAAIIQIRQGERRGMPLVVIGLTAFAAWATYFTVLAI
jgi:hypothetical protein